MVCLPDTSYVCTDGHPFSSLSLRPLRPRGTNTHFLLVGKALSGVYGMYPCQASMPGAIAIRAMRRESRGQSVSQSRLEPGRPDRNVCRCIGILISGSSTPLYSTYSGPNPFSCTVAYKNRLLVDYEHFKVGTLSNRALYRVDYNPTHRSLAKLMNE